MASTATCPSVTSTRIIIGFSLVEYAVNLFFALVGFKSDALPPDNHGT